MQVVAESSHEEDRRPGADLALSGGSVIAGRYRLDEIIGRGGMATVWRGHDQRLGRDVAIKICPHEPTGVPMPIREEHLSSALHHPNIVSIFDAGDIVAPDPGAGCAFIVMEYVSGTTAHQIAPVSWREAVTIIRQAADGLAATHERGIVHCDVKPGNLLIDRRGRVLVADFGIAMPAESELGEFVHGSPAYVAPERLSGERADPRADVYGLGGVLLFLITGSRPADDAVRLPIDCPSEIGNVIARARSSSPHERYADAREFRQALDLAAGSASRNLNEDAVTAERPTMRVATARGTAGAGGLRRHAATDSSRQVISHPTRIRPAHARQPAQQTAAMSPSPVRLTRPANEGHRRRRASRTRPATLIAAGIAGLLLLIVTTTVLRQIISVDQATTGSRPVAAAIAMPNVEGQTLATAVSRLTEQGLVVERVDVIYGPGPINQVVVQHPAAGVTVGEDEPITLVVRTGR